MKESSTDKICQNYRFVIVHLGYEEAFLSHHILTPRYMVCLPLTARPDPSA